MSDAGTLALVESPAQLLNVVELAHTASLAAELGDLRVAVLAPSVGRGRDQLRAVVAMAREDGLEVTWHEPRLGGASVARTVRGLVGELGRTRRLVVGDPFSGVLQVLIGLVRPTDVTIVDDGTATLEFVRQWAVGEALHRWHQPVVDPKSGVAGAARHQVAATLRRRLSPEQGTRLRLFTCMPLAQAGLGGVGVEVVANTYAWLRGRWSAPEVRDGVDLVGTSLAESGVVEREAYVAGVERLVVEHRVTRYLAHRREAADKLDQVRSFGVEVVTPSLPLEVEARRGPVNGTLISFPSTVVHTLPVVLSDTTAQTFVCDIPESWYAAGTDAAAGHFLQRVTTSAQGSQRLALVAG